MSDRIRLMRHLRAVLVALAVLATQAGQSLAISLPWAGEPYPRSEFLLEFKLDWSSLRQYAFGSDNWPITWAADGALYTSFGDGGGFGPDALQKAYVSLGIAKITGNPRGEITGENLVGGLNPTVRRCPPIVPPERADKGFNRNSCAGVGIGGKSRGVLALGKQLYLWWTPSSGTSGYKKARILRYGLEDHDFEFSEFKIDQSSGLRLIFPTFMQAGRNLAHSDYVYSYAARYGPIESELLNVQRSSNGFGEVYLMRANKNADLLKFSSHQYFAGPDPSGKPIWSSENKAKPVFRDKNGVGPRVSAIYIPQLDRYILISPHTRDLSSYFGIFESENPWGPWRTVYYDQLKHPSVPTKGFFMNFVPNAFSSDGADFTVALTGVRETYAFTLDWLNLINGKFSLGATGPKPDPDSDPPAPGDYQPRGVVSETNPAFLWPVIGDARRYILTVSDAVGDVVFSKDMWHANANCGVSQCRFDRVTGLQKGAYNWRVRARYRDGAYTAWSDSIAFSIDDDGLPPDPPTSGDYAPSGTVAERSPLFRWPAVPIARRHAISVEDTTGNTVFEKDMWHTNADCDAQSCTFDRVPELAEGVYSWRVRSKPRGGDFLPWSEPVAFVVDADASSPPPGSGGGDPPEPPSAGNGAPIVNAGPDLNVNVDSRFDLVGQARDDDTSVGNGLALQWRVVSSSNGRDWAVKLLSPNALSMQAKVTRAGQYTVQLEADDGRQRASDTLVITAR